MTILDVQINVGSIKKSAWTTTAKLWLFLSLFILSAMWTGGREKLVEALGSFLQTLWHLICLSLKAVSLFSARQVLFICCENCSNLIYATGVMWYNSVQSDLCPFLLISSQGGEKESSLGRWAPTAGSYWRYFDVHYVYLKKAFALIWVYHLPLPCHC